MGFHPLFEPDFIPEILSGLAETSVMDLVSEILFFPDYILIEDN